MPMVAERQPCQWHPGKEPALEQSSPKPSYQFFVCVDIAYQTFTAASLAPGAKPKRELKAFEQTAEGFERFQQRLRDHGIEPAAILIVMDVNCGKERGSRPV